MELLIRALVLAGLLVAWVIAGEPAAASSDDVDEPSAEQEESRRLLERNEDFQAFLRMRSQRPDREQEVIQQMKVRKLREEAVREAARLEHIRTRHVYSMAEAERLEALQQQRIEQAERQLDARRKRYIFKRDRMKELAKRLDRVEPNRELDLQPGIEPEHKVLGDKK